MANQDAVQMEISVDHISFAHPQQEDFDLILEWFQRPHVSEFFDDPDLGRSIPDLKNYLNQHDYFWTPWLAYYDDVPFAYLMTAPVSEYETDVWLKWREKTGETYSLDILIGDEAFLGKGLSHQMIKKFIQTQFAHAAAFLIDPELRNLRAIHVYEKAGFVIVDEFKGEYGRFKGIPHLMMKLKL